MLIQLFQILQQLWNSKSAKIVKFEVDSRTPTWTKHCVKVWIRNMNIFYIQN